MKKTIILLVLALTTSGLVKAGPIEKVITQKITLNNGTEFRGYIEKQDAKGNIAFHSEEAIVSLKGDDVTITNERNYKLSELSDAWIKWAEENNAFEGVGNNRTLLLCDVVSKTKTVAKVRVLERGITVKYVEQAPNTYMMEWNDVKAITGEKRPLNALSGVNRVYKLKNGVEFEGEFAEETDSTLSLYMSNGMVQSFKIDDVVKYTYKTINPDQSLFEQCELLDIVRTKNSEAKGIIIEQNYTTNKDSVNYLLLQQEGGAINSFRISEVIETKREPNPRYAPKYDILLEDGEIVINRIKTEQVGVKENGDFLVLDNLPDILVIVKKDKHSVANVTLEYNDATDSNAEKFKLVKVIKSVVKKKDIYNFSYRDLVNMAYRPVSIETSINHTAKVVYAINDTQIGENVFAFYDAISRTAIPFIIK